jgi:hypothetical protein
MKCKRDLEGIVAKHRAGLYDTKARWVKIKNPATQTEGPARKSIYVVPVLIKFERTGGPLSAVTRIESM